MPQINNAGALREWLRTCPAIDRTRPFGVDYLGDGPGYALSAIPSALKYRENILGGTALEPRQSREYWLDAREPYGGELAQNLDNLGFFQDVADWILAQNAAGNLPEWSGGRVTAVLPALSAAPDGADSDSARYRLRLRVTYEI